jgi:2-dehydropantoate 2-reductase
VSGQSIDRFPATCEAAGLGPVDLALVLVDANATAQIAGIAESCLAEHGFALTLQNGIGNWETLAARLGAHRVMAGSTYNSGANLGPGKVSHTNLGPTVIGELDGTRSDRALTIARMLESAGLPVEVSDNVQGHVWSKFVHNCAINPVSAVTGLLPFEIAATPVASMLLDRLLDEILAVVAAAGVRLPEHDPRAEIHAHCSERTNRPSMLQHLESGRATEIDALNGALVQRAKGMGLAVPFNEAIVLIVKSLETRAKRQGS